MWELDWNLGLVGSCKKTHQRWVNKIFAPNTSIAQKTISRREKAQKTSKSLYKCKNTRRGKGDRSSFVYLAPSSIEKANKYLRNSQGIIGQINKRNG